MQTRSSRPRRLFLWGLLALPVVLLLGCTAGRLREASLLARESEPLQRRLAQPRARLLIVGDSTAVGTGASAAQNSLAGLIGRARPDVEIVNRARDGATFADVAAQLGPAGERFDAVLIQAGGNDVIRLRNLDDVAADVDRALRQARALADLVVVMPAGNVGNAPFFFAPLSWWMTSRSRRLHAAVRAAAARHGAVYVGLFKERDDDPFVREPSLNARDGLHPSDAGYRVWFDELAAQSPLLQRLGAPAPGR